MELRTDIEFENKIPPLSADELIRLQGSIITEGRLISPIVVWNGIIVDGHNRYRFIRQHPEIEYEIYEKDFDDRTKKKKGDTAYRKYEKKNYDYNYEEGDCL